MKTYDIYNFDHGFTTHCTITTDSFRIIITDEHCLNLKKLPKHSSFTFTRDHNFEPIVVENSSQEGTFTITGVIEIDDQFEGKSLLFPKELSRNYIYDITLVLSFLTGRYVYLENEIDQYSSKFYLDGPVTQDFFVYKQIKYENIQKISQLDLDVQFYNTVKSCSINDLLSLTAYCNSSIDKICTNWSKKNGKTKFEKSELLNSLRHKAIEHVTDSLCSKVIIKFRKYLKNEKIDDEVIRDIEARVRIDTSPSAIHKLKAFLKYYDLYPKEDNDENSAKLRWINVIRNRVAHEGDLPKDKKIPWMTRAEITSNITILMLSIIQWYFAKIILGIENYRLNEMQKDIKNYFISGKFRNKDIFNEKYEDYRNRITNEWIENNKL